MDTLNVIHYTKSSRLTIKKHNNTLIITAPFKGTIEYNQFHVYNNTEHSIEINKCSSFCLTDYYTNKKLPINNNKFIPISNRIKVKLEFTRGKYVLQSIKIKRLDLQKLTNMRITCTISPININNIFDKIYVINREKDVNKIGRAHV